MTRKMKRKIPILKVNMEKGIDYNQLKDIPEIKKIIIEESIRAIKEGVEKKKNSIVLLEIADSNCYIEIKKEKWTNVVDKALEYFVEKEDYDKCIEVRDLKLKL